MKKPDASNQPNRQRWTLTKLAQAHATALSNSVDLSTQQSYGLALNSWLAFVNLHEFPFEPTLETLSYFIVYMSHHINPQSVKCYLSDLVQQLEPNYPTIRDLRNSRHITKVMCSCLKMNTKAVSRKSTLSLDDVCLVCDRFKHSISHNDLLFVAMLSTGFHGLLRLGELTLPDSSSIRDWCKVTQHQSLVLRHNEFEFLLPAHKADHFFEGNCVLIRAFSSSFDPVPVFLCYLFSCDHLFPAATPLWLTSKGEVPS